MNKLPDYRNQTAINTLHESAANDFQAAAQSIGVDPALLRAWIARDVNKPVSAISPRPEAEQAKAS